MEEEGKEGKRRYICIDLKSYYASVECVARGLDPLQACLLVADESRTDKTICLAVSPALKAMGVPGRPRLFEARECIRRYEARSGKKVQYIVAPPRMAEYIRISARIWQGRAEKLIFGKGEQKHMKFEHFFWDYDGTLFDTYDALTHAYLRAAKEIGIDISYEEMRWMAKHSVGWAAEQLGERAGPYPRQMS